MCILRELLGQATTVPSSVRSSARVGTDRSCSSVLGLQEPLGLPGVVLSPHSAGALPTSQEGGTLAGEKEPVAAVWPGAACKETWIQGDVPSGESERQVSALSQCGNGLYEQREKKDRWHQSD